MNNMAENNILEVKRLKVSFRTNNGTVKAVRDISFNLKKGKTLAIVGESGSGKSVTSKVILGISAGNAIIEGGEVLYDNKDIIKLNEDEMYKIRGDKIAMIFQDPLSSLNPIIRIGAQITEAMLLKNKEKRKTSRKIFNSHLRELKNNMIAAYQLEGIDFSKEAKQMCDEFNNFNIEGIKLENSFNTSMVAVHDALSILEDFLFLANLNKKQNVPSILKKIRDKILLIEDPYLIKQDAPIIKQYASELKALAKTIKHNPSEKKTIVPEQIISKAQEIQQFLLKLSAQPKPNFFRFGYYLLHHEKENLALLPIEEAEAKTLQYLDENFMNKFTECATKGIEYSYKQALEGKKSSLPYFDELLEFFNHPNFEKDQAFALAKKSTDIMEKSFDKLSVESDTIAYTFSTALKDFVKKYFQSQKENIKDEARYNRQVAQYEKKIARGKKLDWKVVPAKNIDLEDIRQDILSLIQRLKDHYVDFINKADQVDFNKICITLIDQFKQQASDVVFKLSKNEAKEKALKLMEEVGIPEPRLRYRQYPFEFSGGMRQRIVIAIALSSDPEILICDEPTTALDVTIQAQILELINDIKKKRQLSIIFITHDLGVVANMADEIAVMYAGKIVEYGTSEDIFYDPRHPYTWALLSSMPDLDTKEKLEAIPGTPPNMIYPPKGDAFAARNKYAMQIDFEEEPPMFKISDTHYAATWLLHPDAPKVETPKIILDRIKRMRKKEKNDGK